MSVSNKTTFGRETIYTSVKKITKENIRTVIQRAMQIHEKNRTDIKYLIEYEKGKQEILNRIKEVRPEINEKIAENHASQIVNFKLSYVFGSPITYVQRAEKESSGGTKDVSNDDLYVTKINEMCFDQNKTLKDQELAKKFLTCGVAYRGCFQNKNDYEYCPFKITNLDPMSTFVIYSADVFHEPVIAVCYWRETEDDGTITNTHYTAYTDESVFTFDDVTLGEIDETTNGIGIIPIVEYRYDYEKMGCFERVITLLDAINICTSDRINGLAQFVQSFLWFDNIDIDSKEFKALKEAGAFATESKDGRPTKIQLIESSLNQNEIQSLSDYLYAQLLQICNIPGRDSQSGSTTGQSTMLSGGWQEAEEDAHRIEQMFMEGERRFLKVMKNILDRSNTDIPSEIKLRDIDIKFSRNKIANILVKTQGLLNMKTFGIHPRIAIQTSDLFSDANQVYLDSMEYLQTNKDTSTKSVQEDPTGNNPETVKETQNEQTSFIGSK